MTDPSTSPEELFRGGGEMGARMRAFDWASTPLGPAHTWPPELRTTVRIMLAARQPMFIGWSRDLIALYNDAYRPMLGTDKHPGALGAPFSEVFASDAYPQLRPILEALLDRGEAVAFEGAPVPLVRSGYLEETFFDFGYTPVHSEGGEVGGMFVACTESTERVLGNRRTRTLAELAPALIGAREETRIAQVAIATLARNPQDVPFALLYLPGQMGELTLAAQTGLADDQLDRSWRVREAFQTQEARWVRDLEPVQAGPWPEPVTQVAALPLVHSDGHSPALGVLVVGINARRRLDDPYRHFLGLLAQHLSSALERAEQARQLDEERAALSAFARFTEASTQVTDVLTLSRQAAEVLRAALGDVSVVYYERDGDLWKARTLSGDIPASTARMARVGLSADLPTFVRPFQERGVVFVDGWEGKREGIENTEGYGAIALYPYFERTSPSGLLTIGSSLARAWTERERSIFLAVSQSLELAFVRSEQTARLAAQNVELAARTRALEAFADLTRDLSVEADPYALIRRAQEVVLSLLPEGVLLYYEPEGPLWRLKSQVGEMGNASLQEAVDRGLPYEGAQNLVRPWTTGGPYYQDEYDQGTDQLQAEQVEHVHATATLPVLVKGEPRGVFVAVVFRRHQWTGTDKAVLETVVRSLGLAIEGAQGVAQLAEERRKLGVANEELEAFSYSVSHDLRTPVRHILGFNNLLRQTLEDRLDDKSRRYLKVVDEAAGRMNTLIDALLDLSRTSRSLLQVGVVDLDALVKNVATELEADILGRRVDWQIAPLPRVVGDYDTLRQVVVNLLSNALKYTRTRDVTQIRVWAEERPGEWAVFVQDNGVGFDPRYGDKLFGVFQRLHRQDEFEGTGVGLANVQRVIARHGGQVLARGEPGRGATFGFTLPRPLSVEA